MSYYGNAAYPNQQQQPPSQPTSSYGQQNDGYGSSSNDNNNNDNNNQSGYSTGQWQSNNPSANANQTQQQQQQPAPQYNQWQPPQQQQMAPAQQSHAPMMQQQPQQQAFMGQQQQQSGTSSSAMATATALAATAFATGQFPSQAIEDAGSSFLKESWAKMIPGLDAYVLTLRTYFAVDNDYVLQKIKNIMFPFLKKEWQRNIKGYGGPDGSEPQYDLPIADENAPDLYLPSMSLITYTLLSALLYGNAGKFNPEVIPAVTTKCFLTQVLEVVFIRFGVYLLMSLQKNNQNTKVIALLDLLSYTGYKYLGLSVNMLLALMAKHFGLGVRVYYISFLWTASAASFFMFKTMNNVVPTTYIAETDSKRAILVIIFAAAQFVTMWFVSQTKFL